MKQSSKVLFLVLAFVLCISPAWADGAKSPEEFASKVKEAIAAKDSETISGLYIWEGVEPDIEELLKESIEMMLEEPRKAEVLPIPDDFQSIQEMGGKRYSQNLKVEGVIRLVYSAEDGSIFATMPFGAKEGRYYFAAPIPE